MRIVKLNRYLKLRPIQDNKGQKQQLFYVLWQWKFDQCWALICRWSNVSKRVSVLSGSSHISLENTIDRFNYKYWDCLKLLFILVQLYNHMIILTKHSDIRLDMKNRSVSLLVSDSEALGYNIWNYSLKTMLFLKCSSVTWWNQWPFSAWSV